jgi:hypothetical protein
MAMAHKKLPTAISIRFQTICLVDPSIDLQENDFINIPSQRLKPNYAAATYCGLKNLAAPSWRGSTIALYNIYNVS